MSLLINWDAAVEEIKDKIIKEFEQHLYDLHMGRMPNILPTLCKIMFIKASRSLPNVNYLAEKILTI